ncbi:hypothetical protein EI200_11240 [Peribacillus simplex]|nr:hypothetical protein EI200_11240 [Peribacillus simplex]
MAVSRSTCGVNCETRYKKTIKKWGPSVVKLMLKSSEAVEKVVAKDLGYAPTSHLSKKAVVYYNKKGKPKYIVTDRDSHIGGSWKGIKGGKSRK